MLQMVLLYKDPKGDSITETTMTPTMTKENVLQLNNHSLRSKLGNDNKRTQAETSPK
jgi:regulator of replication initiation timing